MNEPHNLPTTGWRIEGERAAWPRVVGRPHELLRGLLARPYVGLTTTAPPHRLLMPASAAVSLVVKLTDSRHRPAAFLHGPRGHYTMMDGECARSYVEVWLAPLGAYRLLGRPIGELDSCVVDLQDVFGSSARRLIEVLRDAPTWQGRFPVLDRFLLAAADRGPRPSAELVWAWRRVHESGGAVRIGRIADEVGWSHKH